MAVKWYCEKCIATYKVTPFGPPEQRRCESPKCKLATRATFVRQVKR